MMTEDPRDEQLTLADLPAPDADWMEICRFALSFEGYDYASRRCVGEDPTSAAQRLYEDVCDSIYERGSPQEDFTLEDLRCALFRHQRVIRWNEPDVMPAGVDRRKHAEDLYQSAAEVGLRIIDCMRRKLMERGSAGG